MSDAVLDVAVLGGGPAGSAAALALGRHNPSLSVGVFEASTYSAVRVGESLPPPARRLLEHLGVWREFVGDGHDPSFGTAAAWGNEEPYDKEFIWNTYREGWHLDRARFDALLARLAAARGARVRTGCAFVAAERVGDLWQLTMRDGEEQVSVQARFVVDATGRRAAFVRHLGVGRVVCDRLVGLYGFFGFPDGAELPGARTLVEAWREGWWYSARLPDGRLAVACMSDADRVAALELHRRDSWLAALGESEHTSRLVTDARLEEGPTCHAACSQQLESTTGDGWVAVGDVAGALDPLSSQGIFKALTSAIWAAYAVSDYLDGDAEGLERYGRRVERDFDAYLGARLGFYRQERRWPDSPFWSRRAGAVTLDPNRQLIAASDRSGRTHLTRADVRRLSEICKSARPAHEIVAEFQRQRPGAVNDERLILALQDLLAQEVLVAVTPTKTQPLESPQPGLPATTQLRPERPDGGREARPLAQTLSAQAAGDAARSHQIFKQEAGE